MARVVEYDQDYRIHPADRDVPYDARVSSPAYHAYQILHWGFVAVPVIAGIDKFFHYLTNWNQYLAPQITRLDVMREIGVRNFMLGVGVVEIVAGLLVALKPRIGAYVVSAWLFGIIVNLFLRGAYWDVALRDFGLMLGALALGRLADVYEHRIVRRRRMVPVTAS